MHMRLVLAALAAVGVLAGATPGSAITNGVPDGTGHPYVGMMVGVDYSTSSAWLCSGSLVSSGVFLTAGHCTDGADAAYIWFDSSIATNPIYLSTADAVGTPHTNPDFCFGCGKGLPGGDYRDVGVVTIDDVLTQLPTTYADLPAPGQVDSLNKASIDLVGYGVTFQAQVPGSLLPPPPPPPPYVRWTGDGTRVYAPSLLVSGEFKHSDEFVKLALNPGGGSGGTCFGDSGGPDLLGGTNTVLAVNSYGTNVNCSGVGYSQRIDIPDVLDWINGFTP